MSGEDDFGLNPKFAIEDRRLSERVQHFPESVIREMTRLCNLYEGINLAQGFPDFDPPEELREAAKRAIDEGYNQYSITWGSKELRDAIAAKVKRFQGLDLDPEKHIVVTCGATEAMMASMLSIVNPGDEVIIFEPFYENYGPDAIVSGARPRFVPMAWPNFQIDEEALKAAFTLKTKAIILNTPNNPTGKVFSREELKTIADMCVDHDAIAVTDEIYEHIVYDGFKHISIATLDDMWERTITISGLSKTYSVTGWRLGYCTSTKTLIDAIKRTHDFLTVGAPHPLQQAAVLALNVPIEYYHDLEKMYDGKRRILYDILRDVGFECILPRGAYYIMADFSNTFSGNDVDFAHNLVRNIGVAAVPGSSFYSYSGAGRKILRFTFSKKDETLKEAGNRLRALQRARS